MLGAEKKSGMRDRSMGVKEGRLAGFGGISGIARGREEVTARNKLEDDD
jgi:hypothetical protein